MKSISIFTTLLLCQIVATGHGSPHWSYDESQGDGPLRWGEQAAYYECGNGSSQTPINIMKSSTTYMSYPAVSFANANNNVRFRLANNGHAINGLHQPTGGQASPILSGGPLGSSQYTLYNYHLHFGNSTFVASEHAFNNRRTTGELHIVTYNTKFANIGAAVASGESNALAVVGILFDATSGTPSPTNSILDRTIRWASNLTYAGDGINIEFNFTQLISNDAMTNYYTYLGSLTTPGCHEVVTWLVLDQVVYVSNTMIQTINSLVSGSMGSNNTFPVFGNTRPLQPLNGRVVSRSFMLSSASQLSASFSILALISALLLLVL